MRKAVTLLVAATSLAALTVTTPNKANACGWECWAIGGAVVVGGALIASSAYGYGYRDGYYGGGPGYGPTYYTPPRPATYGYYQPPYYDYGPAYYRPAVRYVTKVRYVRQEYVEPVYYEPAQPVYYRQPAPQPNYVRVRY